jgi:TRAP-type uncharacterized transport system substrate-binding protein
MGEAPRRRLPKIKLPSRLATVSWRDLAMTVLPMLLIIALAVWATFRFVRPAPPDTITITAGPEGGVFWTHAEHYRKILARNRVKVEILSSQGSLENLRRLNDPAFKADVGFVQGGVAAELKTEKLFSLGSMFNQPLVIFYRGDPIRLLSELRGRRVTVGLEGSGAHVLALALLKANGIEPGGPTRLVELSGQDAAEALMAGKVDAAFLMADNTAPATMRKLMLTPGVRVFDFVQAEAYIRRFHYLNRLELPMGSLDLGKNVPPRNLRLIGPTVELVARKDLHPALSDLLVEAATEVHGGAGLLRRAGEFPSAVERDFPISDQAARYYKSGKGFWYRYLPFWAASLVDRLAVLLVPLLVLLIPATRIAPGLYRWRVGSRIYRWYGALLTLERDMRSNTDPAAREEFVRRLDQIEQGVNGIKVPLAFGEQFYVLREHISFVRGRLAAPETKD